MANMSGVIPFEFDAALLLKEGHVTADEDTAVRKLQSDGAYWQGHRDVKNGRYGVVLLVKAVTGTTPTLNVIVKTGSSAAKANPQTVETVAVAGAGRYFIPIDETLLADADADATHWWLTFDVGGTTPDYDVVAYIAPYARNL